jgi:hypothetical protein
MLLRLIGGFHGSHTDGTVEMYTVTLRTLTLSRWNLNISTLNPSVFLEKISRSCLISIYSALRNKLENALFNLKLANPGDVLFKAVKIPPTGCT